MMRRHRYIVWLYNELPQLIRQQVISPESAGKIKEHYGEVRSTGRMGVALAIFSVIGAVCVGLGVILLFAYNWDKLSRMERTLLAFAPLTVSCLLMAWAVFKEKTSFAVREGVSVFNMLSVGGAIALISQIYHLPGDIDSFLLTWMLLSIPLVYLMSASLPAVLYLVGITTWAAMSQISGSSAVLFWPLVAGVFPHYLKHFNKDPYASRSVWLSSAVCLCFTVAVGISLEKVIPGLWIIVYSSFYAALYLVSKFWFDEAPSAWQKPFRNYGVLGTLVLSYLFSYEWVWQSIGWRYYRTENRFHAEAGFADYIVTIVLLVSAVALLVRAAGQKKWFECNFGVMPILAVLCYSVAASGDNEFITVWIYNLYVLYLGIMCVLKGVQEKELGLTNGGILIIGLIIFTRFMDASMGIMERGIIFIIVGACFILANVFFSKKFQKEATS